MNNRCLIISIIIVVFIFSSCATTGSRTENAVYFLEIFYISSSSFDEIEKLYPSGIPRNFNDMKAFRHTVHTYRMGDEYFWKDSLTFNDVKNELANFCDNFGISHDVANYKMASIRDFGNSCYLFILREWGFCIVLYVEER